MRRVAGTALPAPAGRHHGAGRSRDLWNPAAVITAGCWSLLSPRVDGVDQQHFMDWTGRYFPVEAVDEALDKHAEAEATVTGAGSDRMNRRGTKDTEESRFARNSVTTQGGEICPH